MKLGIGHPAATLVRATKGATFAALSPPAAAGYIHVPYDLKLGIGHPASTLVRGSQRRDFGCSLATCGGGVHPWTRAALDQQCFVRWGRAQRDVN